MIRLSRILIVMLCICAAPAAVFAHALQPGYLELQAMGSDQWRVLWRIPDVQGRPMPIGARLPDNCEPSQPPPASFDGSAWTARWVAMCPGGLAGGAVEIPGLSATRTDVLVRYELSSGDGQSQRLTPQKDSFNIPVDPGPFEVVASYFSLGVDHILAGFDHLLFVFALLLLIPDRWKLIGAITAFTVAHSLTMALVTLGFVTLPGPPVEAVIALSIMFLASELLQREAGRKRLSENYPWIVSFTFGLLHGFGFAGALLEIGLPRSDVPLALFSFNLGVEAGQLLFVAAVLLPAAILSMLAPKLIRMFRSPGTFASTLLAYAIGGLSATWFIERVSSF